MSPEHIERWLYKLEMNSNFGKLADSAHQLWYAPAGLNRGVTSIDELMDDTASDSGDRIGKDFGKKRYNFA